MSFCHPYITIATAENKLDAVATLLKLLGAGITKTELHQQNVVHARTQQLKVTTNPPQKVMVDGEIIDTTTVEVKCVPDGLKVLVSKTTAPLTE